MSPQQDLAGSVSHVYLRLRDGDRQAASELWRRYYPRLIGLAKKSLAGRPQQVADADDAVQSAFFTFWRQVEQGDFSELQNRDELWRLLGTITVRKAMRHAERENAQKRGGGKVSALSSGAVAAVKQWPAQEFDLACEEMLLALDDEMRQIALYKLMGHTTVEIAQMLGCTTRKVERKTALIRDIWSARD